MSDDASAVLTLFLLLSFFVAVFLLLRALIGHATRPKCPRCGKPLVWNTTRREYRHCRHTRVIDEDGYEW